MELMNVFFTIHGRLGQALPVRAGRHRRQGLFAAAAQAALLGQRAGPVHGARRRTRRRPARGNDAGHGAAARQRTPAGRR